MPVLKLALAKLTRRNAYLAALGAGGPRYDIDGRPSGMISPDDQQAAGEGLQRRLGRSPQAMARRKERKIAAAVRSCLQYCRNPPSRPPAARHDRDREI